MDSNPPPPLPKKEVDKVRQSSVEKNGISNEKKDPTQELRAASRRPSALFPQKDADFVGNRYGDVQAAERKRETPRKVSPPQFYFGQAPEDKTRSSNGRTLNGQTAIDKVKQNEALSHPRRKEEEEPETNNKKQMSVITVTTVNEASSHGKKSASPTSMSSSAISSLSSPSSSTRSSSSFGSRRAKEAKGSELDEGYRSPSLPKEDVPDFKVVSAH